MALTRNTFKSLRRVAVVVVLAVCAALGPGAAPASAESGPVGFQASGGYYTEHEAAFIGAGLHFGLATVSVVPNFEVEFIEKSFTYSLNVDGRMSVLPLGVGSGYLGAGIGWWRNVPNHGSATTDTVWNLLAATIRWRCPSGSVSSDRLPGGPAALNALGRPCRCAPPATCRAETALQFEAAVRSV
jgi:hypothetical protein